MPSVSGANLTVINNLNVTHLDLVDLNSPMTSVVTENERRVSDMAKKPKTLKEIAIELLEKYEASETTVICEYSTNIRHSVELLGKEVAKYRKMIDKAECKESE